MSDKKWYGGDKDRREELTLDDFVEWTRQRLAAKGGTR